MCRDGIILKQQRKKDWLLRKLFVQQTFSSLQCFVGVCVCVCVGFCVEGGGGGGMGGWYVCACVHICQCVFMRACVCVCTRPDYLKCTCVCACMYMIETCISLIDYLIILSHLECLTRQRYMFKRSCTSKREYSSHPVGFTGAGDICYIVSNFYISLK